MYNGIIVIHKEPGYTSSDVVAKMRGILRTRKMGHTGTLDPDAVGVLPVCLGNATKLVELIADRDKEYLCRMRLGVVTDTQDTGGEGFHRFRPCIPLSGSAAGGCMNWRARAKPSTGRPGR